MFILITCLIIKVNSTNNYDGEALTITDLSTISHIDVYLSFYALALNIYSGDSLKIEDYAFKGFSDVKSLHIICGKLTIGSHAFEDSTEITNILIEATDVNIKRYAFNISHNLTYHHIGLNLDYTNFILPESNLYDINIHKSDGKNIIINPMLINCGVSFTIDDHNINGKNGSNIILHADCSVVLQSNFYIEKNINSFVLYTNGSIVINESSFNSMNINNFDIYANESVTLMDNAFKNVTISSLNINTNDSAVFDLSYFQQYNYYLNFEIHTCKDVSFFEHSFQYANIGSMKLYSNGSVKFADESFRIIEHFNELEIHANESITFDQKSFSFSDVNSIKLYSNQNINFYEDSFYATGVQIIEIHALCDIFFETRSFQGSLDSLKLYSNGNISLDYKSFDHHGRTINDLEIYSVGDIILMDKYINYQFKNIVLYSKGSIRIGYGFFYEKNITSCSIFSPLDIIFDPHSFENSKIEELFLTNGNKKNAMYLEEPYKILFAEESFNNCTKLRSINISTNNNIEIHSLAFGNYTSMERMNVHTGGKVTVHDYAFNGCKSSDNIIIEANETNISAKAYGDNLENNGNKKKHGSSHKNNDDISEISAKTYPNFKIQSVYLGTSPNIYANLNIFANFMKIIRKTFGHIVPSPEFIHSAIWVGPKNVTDETYGAIFVYGKYYNIYKINSYLKEDGAKAYVIKLKDFKVRYPLIDPIKLTSKRNIKLYDFIYEVENSGKLRASDYNWPTNNCQHFTAKLINILHAIRTTPDKDDWINIPKIVLNSLQSNEND